MLSECTRFNIYLRALISSAHAAAAAAAAVVIIEREGQIGLRLRLLANAFESAFFDDARRVR